MSGFNERQIVSNRPPHDMSKIVCECGRRGTFHDLCYTKDGEYYVLGWIILWFDAATVTARTQAYPGYRPDKCIGCALKERDRRNEEKAKWLAQEATRKVNNEPKKRSWLSRLWG